MILPVARATETPRLELGQALVFLYGFFAFAAGGRSAYQLATRFDEAPLAVSLSVVAAAVYALAFTQLRRRDPRAWRLAVAACSFELVGVLVIGSVSLAYRTCSPRDGLVDLRARVRILPALPPDRRIDLAAPARDPARVSGELAGVASASPWRAAPTSAGSRASASGSTSSGRGRSRPRPRSSRARDVLAVMPTGSGKSAIYAIAGLLRPGATVVVSPLLALQRDQVENLEELEVGSAPTRSSETAGAASS